MRDYTVVERRLSPSEYVQRMPYMMWYLTGILFWVRKLVQFDVLLLNYEMYSRRELLFEIFY